MKSTDSDHIWRLGDDRYGIPESIRIASDMSSWTLLSPGVQLQIWRRLLSIIDGTEVIAHDRPDLRRLAESSFRKRIERAFGNDELLREFAADCPFWTMTREELLRQNPSDLRRWHRLLRLPKGQTFQIGLSDFVRSLRYAAGLLETTSDS